MSQPNIICLVRQIRRKALLRNGMCTEAPRGVDSRRGEGSERDGWQGDGADRPRRARGRGWGPRRGGGTPTGGVGLYASPLPPPLAIFDFRQPE